jgi:hypothetical protein
MDSTADGGRALAERLESGEIITFETCPFPLPAPPELDFLRRQGAAGRVHKDICYNPARDAVSGFRFESAEQAERLCQILRTFADAAAGWLAALVPAYAQSWQRDRATFRPEEEATRKVRLIARNDLLHLDAFPSRPARGRRILRLFVNINPTDPRVWATSETFPHLLRRYGALAGLPGTAVDGWASRLGQGLLSLFQPGASERTAYDAFMLRLHHFLKRCEEFQDRSSRRVWHFPPQAAWLAFTDGISHAELRGQHALEHSFFIPPQALALPNEAPLAQLEKACGVPVLPRAA